MTTSAYAQRVEESVTLWGIRREGQDPPLQGKSAGAYGIRADRNTAPTVSDEADSFFDSLNRRSAFALRRPFLKGSNQERSSRIWALERAPTTCWVTTPFFITTRVGMLYVRN